MITILAAKYLKPTTAKAGTTAISASVGILSSAGIDVPFDAAGMIPFHMLSEAMKKAGLSQHKQTVVKLSLMESGHRFAP